MSVTGPTSASFIPGAASTSGPAIPRFGHSHYQPDSYAASSPPANTSRAQAALKYALKPGKIIKNGIFWHLALAIPVALSGAITYPVIPAMMLVGAIRRFLKAYKNPNLAAAIK